MTSAMRPMFTNQALVEDGLLLSWACLPRQQIWRGKLLCKALLPGEEGLLNKKSSQEPMRETVRLLGAWQRGVRCQDLA